MKPTETGAYQLRRGYADCRDGQIHYRHCGTANAPVLTFFHQTASSSAMFEQVMLRLADDYKMFAFDTPGFGDSYDPGSIDGIGYYTDRLVEALDYLGIDHYHACGHHTGGCIAVEMPVRYPGRVSTLTLIGAVEASAEQRAEFRKHFSRPFAPDADGAYLQKAWCYLAGIGADQSLELHHRELVDHLRAWRSLTVAFNAVWDQDFSSFHQRVVCPILHMCSEDDVVWPFHLRARQMRPDAAEAIVTGADFQCDVDPDGVADSLRRFLEQHADE
jgi:pimeloyl-ACP methyl ester carboxylesterase